MEKAATGGHKGHEAKGKSYLKWGRKKKSVERGPHEGVSRIRPTVASLPQTPYFTGYHNIRGGSGLCQVFFGQRAWGEAAIHYWQRSELPFSSRDGEL